MRIAVVIAHGLSPETDPLVFHLASPALALALEAAGLQHLAEPLLRSVMFAGPF